MAIIYVSQSATNSYAAGSDANSRVQAGSKATPVLTVTRALAVAQAGDQIIINDGTYNEASYINPTVANLRIDPENAYLAIIRAASGTARTLHQSATASNLILGKIVLDANNVQASCSTADSGANVNGLTLDGTQYLNPTQQFINGGSKLYNITLQNGWSFTGNGAGLTYGVVMVPPVAGNITASNGTINITGITGVFVAVYNGLVSGTMPAGCTLLWHDIAYNVTGAAGASFQGSYVTGFTTVDMYNLTYNVSGINTVAASVIVNHNTTQCTHCNVYNLSGSLGGNAGYLVRIGDDTAPVTENNILNPRIWKNNLSGANHGYMFGFVSGGRGWQNKADLVTIAYLIKGSVNTANNQHYGNLSTRVMAGGKAWYMKGCTGANNKISNNTHIISGAYTGMGVQFDATPNAATGEMKNNNVYADATATVVQLASIGSGSTATLGNNNYYSVNALPAGCFANVATTYDNVAAWLAVEASAISVNPQFTNASGADYSLLPASSLITAGAKWWGTNPRPSGIDGEPFPDFGISVGAYQSKTVPFHP